MTLSLPTAAPAAAAATVAAQIAGAPHVPREFLAFKLGAEEYGVDILRVQEIRSYEEPTRIAHAPAFVRGVVNLRGVIVPVLDLRLKFDMPEARCDHLTVVIVINLGERVVGLVVDAVSDVITPTPEQLRPVPEFNATVDTEHLLAIGAIGDRMLILLDIEALMASPEMGLIAASIQ